MKSSTGLVVKIFGGLAGVMGVEHGVGEALQGNVRPEGWYILSWPDSELFAVLAGEPAMTIVPNMLASGVLAIVFSLALLVWVGRFVERRHGGLVLIGLCGLMLLFGGGFGPPFLGVIVGLTAMRMNAAAGRRPERQPGRRPVGVGAVRGHRWLSRLWPWFLGASCLAWLCLFPGTIMLAQVVDLSENYSLVPGVLCVALGTLLLTIWAGLVRDNGENLSHPPAPALPWKGRAGEL